MGSCGYRLPERSGICEEVIMTRCSACRRPLRNPVSLQYGMGPDCLRKAAKAGTAPLEALEELKAWERRKPKQAKAKSAQATTNNDTSTMDLFAGARKYAIESLRAAADECAALGVVFELMIEE